MVCQFGLFVHLRVSKRGKGDWIRIIYLVTNAYHVNPGLIFRTRKAGDLLLCDFCRYYKCDWLNYSPSKYPQNCPEVREFRIADVSIPKEEFMRRVAVAQNVGMYSSYERIWHLSAIKAKNLTAISLKEVMKEISIWSPKNEFGLSKMVEYIPSRDSRTKVQMRLKARYKQ